MLDGPMDADERIPQGFTTRRVRREAEFWLRRQGLPYFVAPDARSALLVARTAPFIVVLLSIDVTRWLLRGVDITVDGSAGALVGLLTLILIAAAVLVVGPIAVVALAPSATCRHPGRMTVVGVVVLCTYLGADPWLPLQPDRPSVAAAALENLLIALLSLILTWAGVGAFATWSARIAGRQLRALREMSGKVLPLLMLVVGLALVAPGLWQVTSALSMARLAGVIVLFAALGQWFIAPVIRSEALAIHEQHRESVAALLSGGSLGGGSLGGPARADATDPALTRGERANLTIALMLAQGCQVALFSGLVALILIVFGDIALTPAVIASWSGGKTAPVELFGLTLPVDTALVKTSIFLSCFASLNFVVNIRSNAAYKSAFYDPLFDDARVALAVRTAYRGANARLPAGQPRS
ncbi:MAG: hypothetical protein JWQ64_1754 [Subtercola sp.]|nr:hypothetical protein [Subtercola sp.]